MKRKKSLGQLCIQFIKLFSTKYPILSLEHAATMLSPSLSPEYNKIKTKIRRLYDIANVLQALNLIEKTLLPNHKPGFKWLGHSGFLTFVRNQRAKIQTDNINSSEITRSQVFTVYCESLAGNSRPMVPRVKHFKPKVLQLSSPFPPKKETCLIQVEGKRRKLDLELNDKENVAIMNFSSLFSESGAFNKLNILHNPRKVGGKSSYYEKHVLMESQSINLVP